MEVLRGITEWCDEYETLLSQSQQLGQHHPLMENMACSVMSWNKLCCFIHLRLFQSNALQLVSSYTTHLQLCYFTFPRAELPQHVILSSLESRTGSESLVI